MEFDISSLGFLFHPRSVAVIGASERPGSPGSVAALNLKRAGYPGKWYPINPNREAIHGVRSYRRFAEIPERVDCAILCVRAELVPALLREAVEEGARSAIVYGSGFGESGQEGRKRQGELKAIARSYGIPLCGPNCIGLVNFKTPFPGLSAHLPSGLEKGGVSAVCQSGSIAIALLNSGRDLPFSSVVSSGNEAVLTVEDYLEYFVEDVGTTVILAFVEAFRNVPKLRAVAEQARERGKPLLILKVGRSRMAQRTVLSHSGSMAGSDAVLDALFRQYGIIRVRDLDEMLETAALFLHSRKPGGERLGLVAVSGGQIGLLADLAEDIGLNLGKFSEKTRAALGALLPPFSPLSNPLDAWGKGELGETYAGCLACVGRDPGIDLIAVSLDVQAGLGEEQAAFYTIGARSIAQVSRELKKPVVVFSNLSGGLHPELRKILKEGEAIVLQGSRESLKAIRHFLDFAVAEGSAPIPKKVKKDVVLDPYLSRLMGEPNLSEHAAKKVLSAYGIPVTVEKLVASLEEAKAAAAEIGFPVALKVDSSDLPHKTEAGAVQLNISDENMLETAYGAVLAGAERIVSPARINGVVVQEMLNLEEAVEVIAGVSMDAQCGPTLLFGLGGVFAEALDDVALRLAPLREADAWAMLEAIRGAGVLKGIRGKPWVDRKAIVEVLLKLSDLAVDHADRIVEVDVNPLVVFPEGRGAKAADALIVNRQFDKLSPQKMEAER